MEFPHFVHVIVYPWRIAFVENYLLFISIERNIYRIYTWPNGYLLGCNFLYPIYTFIVKLRN